MERSKDQKYLLWHQKPDNNGQNKFQDDRNRQHQRVTPLIVGL